MASRVMWASRVASYLRISIFLGGFSTVIKDLKYSDTHEWVKVDGSSATIGITDHAQVIFIFWISEVVYVELPEVSATVAQGKGFGAVESVKATSDVNSPVSGEVVEVNSELTGSPGLINASPCIPRVDWTQQYTNGWIVKVKMGDTGELNSLMDSEQYSKFYEEEDAKH
ncbi:unnamed protein product [Musa textilis]